MPNAWHDDEVHQVGRVAGHDGRDDFDDRDQVLCIQRLLADAANEVNRCTFGLPKMARNRLQVTALLHPALDQLESSRRLFALLEQAVGPSNFAEVSPQQILGRFNGFLKSVILRISEARDLGEFDRFAHYDHMKACTAAPPDVLRVDEKHLREHYVPNVVGVIITTNHKTDGIFLPTDDRRHYVAWSDAAKEQFDPIYWKRFWRWYTEGGFEHVAQYLATLDLAAFDPKAPPPKTSAFWEIVDASRSPEDAEMADALDELERPNAVTLKRVSAVASNNFADWLTDRRNSRRIPHRLEGCGYVPVRNPDADDGLWRIEDKRQAV